MQQNSQKLSITPTKWLFAVLTDLSVVLCFFCTFFVLFSLPALTAQSNNSETSSLKANTQAFKILWLTDESIRAQHIFKGFKHYYHRKKTLAPTLHTQNPGTVEELEALLTKEHYDFIVSNNHNHWFLLKKIKHDTKRLGLMLTSKELSETKIQYQQDPAFFAISEQQPSYRFFALISALELFNSQTTSLFSPHEKKQRLEYETKAKTFLIPFQSIVLDDEKKVIHAINSIKDCCKTLLLKKEDLNGSMHKRKSLLMHSYKNKIMVIADQPTLLKKGAMLALYSQPYEIGLQAAKTVDSSLNNLAVSRFQEPENFMIDSNRGIIRALGFSQVSLGRLINATKESEKIYNTGTL